MGMVKNWKGVSVEAEHHFIEGSMANGESITVAEGVTPVAQAEFEMINVVMEAVGDLLQLIQIPLSIIISKNSEYVK